jgi:hypothetical protein
VARSDRGQGVEMLADEQFWAALFDALTVQMPMAVLALFVGGITVLALYGWTESVTLPAIILALFGGIIILYLPPAAALIATLAVVGVFAAVLAAIYGGR